MPREPWTTSRDCRSAAHCRACQDPGEAGRGFRLSLLTAFDGLPPDGSPPACPHGMDPPPLDAGPGTELKTLLGHFRWLGLVETEGCNCKAILTWMNSLGPEGCIEQLDAIVDRLEANHAKLREMGKAWVPFTRLGASGLVVAAVEIARLAEVQRKRETRRRGQNRHAAGGGG